MSDQWVDRYGGAWPDPATVCRGQCEGTGRVPVPDASAPDGWRFDVCPDCGGTGRADDPPEPEAPDD